MGNRNRTNIDVLFDDWARWCEAGGLISSGGASILSRLIENKGLVLFGSTGGQSPVVDCLELRVESSVMMMSQNSPDCADALRLEYGAGWLHVIKRRNIHGYDPQNARQFEKASALGVSYRTYKRWLKVARDQVINDMGVIGVR